MNRRIQQALDGELPVDQLSVAEREELAAYERAIELALQQVPDQGPAPDMTGAVLWRIAHLPAAHPRLAPRRLGQLRAALRWLWQPHAVSLRPIAALAALVVLLGGGLALSRSGSPQAPAQSANQLVQFRLGAEGVREVALVGDFGGWNVRYPMEQIAPGVWSVAVPLEPGVYDYAFVIDGTEWMLDPLAPAVSDGFGGANSRVSVLSPGRSTST